MIGKDMIDVEKPSDWPQNQREARLSNIEYAIEKFRTEPNYGNKEILLHMLVSIPPKMSVAGFMGYLKGKSSLMIFQKWGNMKFAYRNREFWCKGYYVDTVGKNTNAIKEYIANQLKQDRESEQLSMFDPHDPFTGSK